MVGGRFWGFWNFQLCLPYLYRVQNMPSQNMPQGCKYYSESRACKQQIQESRSDLSFSSWEQEVNAYVKGAILIPVERKPFLLLESGNLCEQILLLTLTFLLTFPQLTVLAQILCLVFAVYSSLFNPVHTLLALTTLGLYFPWEGFQKDTHKEITK